MRGCSQAAFSQICQSSAKRSWICAGFLAAAIVTTAFSPASAVTITFDDLPTPALLGSAIPDGYGELTWTNFDYVAGTGIYANGAVSSPNVAFDVSGRGASISSAIPFELVSFYITSTYDTNLIVSIVASLNGQIADSTAAVGNTGGPVLVTLNWTNITEVTFAPLCPAGTCTGPGSPNPNTKFELDNLTVVPTPLPAALTLFASGIGGLGVFGLAANRKRRKLGYD